MNWQPTALTMDVHYKETDCSAHPHVYAVHQAWCQLTNEVHNAARELGVGSRSWRRCVKELRRITGDDRWTLIARNLDLFKEVNNSREKSRSLVTTLSTTRHGN